MLKSVVGDEAITKIFSEEFALQYFMDWDKDTIEQNARQRFREQIRHMKEDAFLEKVKAHGSVDFADEEIGLDKSLKDILLDDNSSEESSSEEGGEEGDEFTEEELDMGEGEDTGGEDFDMGGEEAAPEEGGEELEL